MKLLYDLCRLKLHKYVQQFCSHRSVDMTKKSVNVVFALINSTFSLI